MGEMSDVLSEGKGRCDCVRAFAEPRGQAGVRHDQVTTC